jgi:hypothetical protein
MQHLEVPAVRCLRARHFIPPEVILAQPLQYFELSFLRRPHAQAIGVVIQVTSLNDELQRDKVPELYGFLSSQFVHLTPRHIHRIAHRVAHRSEPCEI